jgi:hypothetical protein
MHGKVTVRASAFHLRVLQIWQRVARVSIQTQPVEMAPLLLSSAVLVEESTMISLPAERAEWWRGCGAAGTAMEAGGDVCALGCAGSAIDELALSTACPNDHRGGLPLEQLPAPCTDPARSGLA